MSRYKAPWVPHSPEARYLKKTHGITTGEWWELYRAQGKACAICGNAERRLYVDHHHDLGDAGLVRGSVRGLVCWICNQGLQAFRENVRALREASVYLVDPPAWRLWPEEKRET